MQSTDWLVQVPLSQLVQLQNISTELDLVKAENVRLKARMEGLHRTQYELMEIITGLRKEIADRA